MFKEEGPEVKVWGSMGARRWMALCLASGARAAVLKVGVTYDANGDALDLVFQFEDSDSPEDLERKAIAYATARGLVMGEGCLEPSAACVGRRLAKDIIEQRGREGVVAPAAASVESLALVDRGVPTTAEEGAACFEAVLQLRESGAWQHVDLGPYDDLAERVTAATAGADQIRLGHTARRHAGPGPHGMQRQWYVALAQLPCVRRICEVGFNEGHSASLWLAANPAAEVVMFDLYDQPSAPLGEAFLRGEFGDGRLHVVRGASQLTVPLFAATHPAAKCDLVVIDGAHDYDLVSRDISNLRHVARGAFHLLLLDDTAACEAEYCAGPNAALADHERRGTVDAPIVAVSEEPKFLDGFLSGMTLTTYRGAPFS